MEEKETKKKKTTTTKKTTKKKTTPKKVEVVEEKKEETVLENVVDTVKDVADAATAPVKEIIHGNIPKKPSAIIYLLVLLILAGMVVVGVYSYFHQEHALKELDFSYMGLYQDPLIYDDYYRISTEEEFNHLFPEEEFVDFDFQNHQYVLLGLTYDSCSEKNIHIAGYEMAEETMVVTIEYEASCGVCAPEYVYYLLTLDKDLSFDTLKYQYQATNNPHCNQAVAYKPMIYLYPEEETEVTVQLGNPEYILTSYPTYKDRWSVTAYPDGTLVSNNREYYGLFWEGKNHISKRQDVGFVVKGEDTYSFLEEKLAVLGLTEKEANEFIVYWGPILEKNPYNYIYFERMEEIDSYMPLLVEPKPDTMIRIFMDYEGLEEPVEVAEQELVPVERRGFTLVEWGGSKIKD